MKTLLMTGMAAGLLMALAGPVSASALCDDLWIQRNSIYKDNGYCFRTSNAISYFGNAGCVYDDVSDVPLSARERRNIARIVAAERRNRCPK
jgi:hypothetical protein